MIMLLIVPATMSVANANSGNSNSRQREINGNIRVVAETNSDASRAVDNGCSIIRESKGLKALSCTQAVASSLGLKEDVRVFATDLGANIQIRAEEVQTLDDTGEGRRIAVLDTGCNYYHPDLSSSCSQKTMDYVNDDFDPFDDNGHGSQVAGLISGDGISYISTRGVAPDAQIIPVKVLDERGSGYSSDVVAAVYWVVDGPDGQAGTEDDPKVDAISMSIGSSEPYLYKGYCDRVLPSLTDAIRYAVARGILVVVAAGNAGSSGISIPGCISYAITVGAVDRTDSLASFSGIGKAVDIVAPGVSLESAWLDDDYLTASGTSMATPIVSGTIALLKYKHPDYTSTQVESALYDSAKDLGRKGKDRHFGYGRVDAFAALTYSQ